MYCKDRMVSCSAKDQFGTKFGHLIYGLAGMLTTAEAALSVSRRERQEALPSALQKSFLSNTRVALARSPCAAYLTQYWSMGSLCTCGEGNGEVPADLSKIKNSVCVCVFLRM